jgi:hypothetical protein
MAKEFVPVSPGFCVLLEGAADQRSSLLGGRPVRKSGRSGATLAADGHSTPLSGADEAGARDVVAGRRPLSERVRLELRVECPAAFLAG